MPIYEYECRSCGHQLEAFQKITEDDLKKCPQCGKDTLSKLISATSFQLKGTGWYVTDIRDKDKKKPADEKSADEKTAEKKESKDTKDTKETKDTAADLAKTKKEDTTKDNMNTSKTSKQSTNTE